MDFFARQESARRRTRALIAAFALAVAALVAASNGAVALALRVITPRDPQIPLVAHLIATIGTLGVIALGSALKIADLAAGGGAGLAQRLGGRLLAPATAQPDERRLLDVVEEMAIASGVPVPPTYVLPGDDEINAFAAGFGPGDAVIGVTRGAVLGLTRDELQGVVAHEFSHLLNGDTRLDMRLIGVLFGILQIGIIGRSLLTVEERRGSTWFDDGSGDDTTQSPSATWPLGAALVVMGALGTFIGELIRAGVSRSREVLADAAAVQFTRQPGGIAGALKKVGGTGSAIAEPTALEARHVFFACAVGGGLLDGLLATHPPLAERIRAIEPGWDGRFLVAPRPVDSAAPPAPRAADADAAMKGLATMAAAASGRAGLVTARAIAASGWLVTRLPAGLAAAARDPSTARLVVFALVLDREAAPRARQLALLRDREPAAADEAARLRAAIDGAGDGARQGLLDLSAPALKALAPLQRDAFASALRALIACDGRTTLDEWLIARIALGRLDARPPSPSDAAPLWLSAAIVIASLARAGADDDAAVAAAYAAARARIAELPPQPPPPERCTPERLDAALSRLTDTVPAFKRRLVDATAACIDADDTRTAREVELERVVCASLGVPMPMA